nr:klotho-like [Salvelinus alpinus]
MDWVEPAFSFSREDVEPANRVLDCRVGWFSEPIFGSGDYPPRMRNWFHQRHSLDLFHYHLPLFSEEDRQLVRGTYDFFAISHFSTQLVTPTIEE